MNKIYSVHTPNKFVLMKDLPWMKAGTVIEITVNNYFRSVTGEVLAAGCYEETRKYFCDDNGKFEPDGIWFVGV